MEKKRGRKALFQQSLEHSVVKRRGGPSWSEQVLAELAPRDALVYVEVRDVGQTIRFYIEQSLAPLASAGAPLDLSAITTPTLVLALKDDHVSAWDAVYRTAKLLGAEYVLGGSGHNAGVINPPAANKHGYWTNTVMPDDAKAWLETATRHEGSWWPWWTKWLHGKGGGKTVAARQPKDPIEPAPGRYVMMP